MCTTVFQISNKLTKLELKVREREIERQKKKFC